MSLGNKHDPQATQENLYIPCQHMLMGNNHRIPRLADWTCRWWPWR